jgi:hypothetical protein
LVVGMFSHNFFCEFLSHAQPGLVHRDAVHHRIWASEVDVPSFVHMQGLVERCLVGDRCGDINTMQ